MAPDRRLACLERKSLVGFRVGGDGRECISGGLGRIRPRLHAESAGWSAFAVAVGMGECVEQRFQEALCRCSARDAPALGLMDRIEGSRGAPDCFQGRLLTAWRIRSDPDGRRTPCGSQIRHAPED
jgi:hypothetical protein